MISFEIMKLKKKKKKGTNHYQMLTYFVNKITKEKLFQVQ